MAGCLLGLGCALAGDAPYDPLALESFVYEDLEDPTAILSTIRCSVTASGGAPPLVYEFRSRAGSTEIIEQRGPAATWPWQPQRSGTFRVKVTVTDQRGDRVESGWSPEIVVGPPLAPSAPIAVFPVDNLSGYRAPARWVDEQLRRELEDAGLQLLEERRLQAFMERHRVRNTSGVSAPVALAIREDTGSEAVLVTSLEAYSDRGPPLVALTSRLVLSGERPEIVWMDGVALWGDAYPGFLNRGLEGDAEVLLGRALACLAESLASSLPGPAHLEDSAPSDGFHGCGPQGRVVPLSGSREVRRRYRPEVAFRSERLRHDRRYRVAIVPFLNLSEKKHAGRIVASHFASQLLRAPRFQLVEAGLVREQLLRYRIIMQAGPSIANVTALASERSLGVDLVVSGTVFEYRDLSGLPEVDYAVKILEAESRELVWSSRSSRRGNDGVFLFDLGRIYTAHRLSSEMAKGTVNAFVR